MNAETFRYYQADLIQDLFGEWSVITAWGGLGTCRGQLRKVWVANREEGEKQLLAIDKRRRQRGYCSIPHEHDGDDMDA
ncbi:WGR domain-containing protein [Thiocapsa imhoffii]|uniref:WGR domain-containing protein n=1 Tax=Thiocapsa imhoffii TaxID=382777 RepID=UPI0030B8BB25